MGFEPTKHIATELKSVPVDRLGIRVGCSWWGSNPRPIAHKTIALTTELQELVCYFNYLHGVGFEPTKHIALDLESSPFDRSGILSNYNGYSG